MSPCHGDLERSGRQCEAVDRVSPDVQPVLETDIKLLEDVCQAQQDQGATKILPQTSPLPHLQDSELTWTRLVSLSPGRGGCCGPASISRPTVWTWPDGRCRGVTRAPGPCWRPTVAAWRGCRGAATTPRHTPGRSHRGGHPDSDSGKGAHRDKTHIHLHVEDSFARLSPAWGVTGRSLWTSDMTTLKLLPVPLISHLARRLGGVAGRGWVRAGRGRTVCQSPPWSPPAGLCTGGRRGSWGRTWWCWWRSPCQLRTCHLGRNTTVVVWSCPRSLLSCELPPDRSQSDTPGCPPPPGETLSPGSAARRSQTVSSDFL